MRKHVLLIILSCFCLLSYGQSGTMTGTGGDIPGGGATSGATPTSTIDPNSFTCADGTVFCASAASLIVGTDVDITSVTITQIEHTWGSDLDFTLTAGANAPCDLSLGNGGSGGLDVVTDLVFSDTATSPATTFDTTQPMTPEGCTLAALFAGVDLCADAIALDIFDNAGGDSGSYAGWEIAFDFLDPAAFDAVCAPPPPVAASGDMTACAGGDIPGGGATSGATPTCTLDPNSFTCADGTVFCASATSLIVGTDVDITSVTITQIEHTWGSDLDFTLTAGANAPCDLSLGNGGSGGLDVVTDLVFSDTATSPATTFDTTQPMTPEGCTLAALFAGVDLCADAIALDIFDNAGGDSGSYAGWGLSFDFIDPAAYDAVCNPVISDCDPTVVGLEICQGDDASAGITADCGGDIVDPVFTASPAGGGDGTATFDGTSWTLVSSDNGTADDTEICFTAAEDLSCGFDWNYNTIDSDAFWDPLLYSVNGAETTVFDPFGLTAGSGTINVSLAAGDQFCIIQRSFDGVFGAATTVTMGSCFTALLTWYDSVGGTVQGTGSPLDPTGLTAEEGPFDPNVAGTYTFYAECQTADGCISEPTPVQIIVNPNPTEPIAPLGLDVCQGDDVSAGISATCAVGTLAWFDAADGTEQGTGAGFDPTGSTANEGAFDANIAGTYTYFAYCVSGPGCLSEPITVSVLVRPQPDDPVATGLEVCLGDDTSAGISAECLGTYSQSIPEADWTVSTVGDGSATYDPATDSWTLVSTNAGGGGDVSICFTATATYDCSFDWDYSTADGSAFWDPLLYSVNGAQTTIFDAGTVGSGTINVSLNSGDVFCIIQSSFDGIFGAATTITMGDCELPPTLNWYDTPGGTLQGTGSPLVLAGTTAEEGAFDETVPGTYTYYAVCDLGNGCPSDPVPVVVQINEPPVITCGASGQQGNLGNSLPFWYNTYGISIEGGTPPYTVDVEKEGYVNWALQYNGTGADLSINYSDNAEWCVSITDANGCTTVGQSGQFNCCNDDGSAGGEPSIPGANGDVLDIDDVAINGESGTNASDGAIDITLAGCTGGATYEWSGPNGFTAATEDVMGLEAGLYNVTVTCDGETTLGWYWVPLDRNGGRLKVGDSTPLGITTYPNPMIDNTTVEFTVENNGPASVQLFSIDGKFINELYNQYTETGNVYYIDLKGGELNAGTYITVIIDAEGQRAMNRLVVLK